MVRLVRSTGSVHSPHAAIRERWGRNKYRDKIMHGKIQKNWNHNIFCRGKRKSKYEHQTWIADSFTTVIFCWRDTISPIRVGVVVNVLYLWEMTSFTKIFEFRGLFVWKKGGSKRGTNLFNWHDVFSVMTHSFE